MDAGASVQAPRRRKCPELLLRVQSWSGSCSEPSLPGSTPQVGYTRLAALDGADLGQARGPVQSICSRERWMRGSSPIGANLSLATNLSVVMPRFKRGTQ